jgi:hypothetical protein
MDFYGRLVLEHSPRLAASASDAAAGDARSMMADGKHGHADGHNGVVGDVADRPAMATGIFVVAYRRKQPCAYRLFSSTSTNCLPTETTSAMRISAPVSSSCQHR